MKAPPYHTLPSSPVPSIRRSKAQTGLHVNTNLGILRWRAGVCPVNLVSVGVQYFDRLKLEDCR